VVIDAPVLMTLSIELRVEPRPTCAAFEPALPAVAAAPPRCIWVSASLNVVRDDLKPMVLTLARSFAVTSSAIWWIFRPLTAEYMPRIIGASLPSASPGGSGGR
jgi:hypothetical protein